MFHCIRAKTVWKLAGLAWDCLNDKGITFSGWWLTLCNMKDLEHNRNKISLSVYLLWWMWRTRNICLFEKKVISEPQLVAKAKLEWLEFEDIKFGQHLLKPINLIVGSSANSDEVQGIGELPQAASVNASHSEIRVLKGTAFLANTEDGKGLCWKLKTKACIKY
ncbi:2-C-methyl-D-erythritol 4-phosphatecytidylyltransferase [Striga asiatica]|uniref:2-C-methyl-D-erythritol 4-phosphatecytidylyltransferase n=1 Tax=Striga asiatica TaxID=4170 RepID=A0A5A7PS00_STRAF|nr:2-C-methyl-D-erythritol 4-phosphatecytidylyltransferase [Striga asiatica]